MKRYFILILVAILVLTSGVLVGCGQKPESPASPTTPEQTEPTPESPSPQDEVPIWVLEDDVAVRTIGSPPVKLPFDLKVGDRVEGKVSVNHSESQVIAQVRDPYGNTVVETSYVVWSGGLRYVRNRGFPWRFAFTASANGEYMLQIWATGVVAGTTGQPSAHLKITCYRSR